MPHKHWDFDYPNSPELYLSGVTSLMVLMTSRAGEQERDELLVY